MARSDPNYTVDVEQRLEAIENGMTQIVRLLRTALNKEQLNRLTVIAQRTHDAQDTRLTAIEAQLAVLQDLYDQLL